VSRKAHSEQQVVNAYRMLVQMFPDVDHAKALDSVLRESGNGIGRRPGRPREYNREDLYKIFRLMLDDPQLSLSAAARKYVERHDLGIGTAENRVKAVLAMVDRELAAIEQEPYDPRNLVLIELGWRKRGRNGRKHSLDDLKEWIRRYHSKNSAIN
jgi:hypothetical protein